MKDIQIAVMTHNRSASLACLLSSLDRQRPRGQVDVTILDNGSAEPHATEVQRIAERYGARLLRSERNLFVAGKRVLEDEIFSRTKPDIFVRLDDDVVLDDGWLDAVVSVVNAGAAACGSVEDHDGDWTISGQRTFELAEEVIAGQAVTVWDWRWHEPDRSVPSEPVELAGVRALAVDGRVASEVRHDPFFRVGGDADYSLRLREAGHELRVASGAVIRHRTLGESDVVGFRVAGNVIPSWRHFYRRWGFFRRGAAAEAEMSLDDFVTAIVASPADARAGSATGRESVDS